MKIDEDEKQFCCQAQLNLFVLQLALESNSLVRREQT